ncbi:MAG: SPOR domain-containing protein [Desulfobacterales bacterium]
MPTSLTRTINAALLAILILMPLPAFSETAAIPIFLTYPQLRFLAVREMFKGPDNTARYGLDDTGCAFVTYSEPHLSAEGQLLRVEVATLATIGVNTTDGCATIGNWTGRTVVKGKPVLVDGQPLSAEFKVQTAELYNQQGHRLSGTPVLQASEERLHQALSKLRIDLNPEVDRLKEWLPSVLPRYSADRLSVMLDSLRIGRISVRPDGLDVRLTIDVDKNPEAGPEPVLNALEMEQLEQTVRTWDAFLTFVVKQAAIATHSDALRSALLEILLDARYEMKAVLVADADSGSDPVKKLFVRSWERLEPVMREISVEAPEQNPIPFLSFMTAADALMALDRLGPAAGLDISADGLRRLARLLNDNPNLDPLQFLDETDPELQHLFDLGIPEEITPQKKSQGFNLQLIPSAFAATSRDRLNRWVPTADELVPYMREIRLLLLEEADVRIRASTITGEHARIFRKLMLAAAWQESCWRQYVVQKNKIVPLVSGSGDIGLLQINETVWRGFYSRNKLRWDINYNARAGGEILFKFMVNYALKQQEHKKAGGLSNLARASYSAYNGGPSQVNRYRSRGVPAEQKKIDAAFWAKYQQVNRGDELAVVECLGGEAPVSEADVPLNTHGSAASGSKPPATTGKLARVESSSWIRKQPPKHFTLQLAAMSSEQAVKNLVKKQSQPGTYAYCRIKQKDKAVYIAIFGSFSNRNDAQKAAARFASLKPWLRDFGSIQKAMAK